MKQSLFLIFTDLLTNNSYLVFCNPFSEHYAPCIFKPHVSRSLYALLETRPTGSIKTIAWPDTRSDDGDIFAVIGLKVNNGSLIFNGITFARKKRNGNYKSAFILLFVFYVSTQTVIRNRDFYARKQIDFLLPILDWLCFLTEKPPLIR